MDCGEDFSLSHKYATAALMALKEHKLPAVPDHFQLWYAYYSGVPAVRTAIEALLASGCAITPETCSSLCEAHLNIGVVADKELLDTSLKVENTLGQIMQLLAGADNDNARFGETLDAASGHLETAAKDPKLLRRLIDTLARETKQALAVNRHLRAELKTSSHEIDSLRGHLEEVRREAMTDALTGIGNRKLFDIQIRKLVAAAIEAGTDLSLLMMDIDHFKRFNDKHGHQLGDQVLRLVARCLTDCVKGRDVAARYGGEEFAVILPSTALDNAVTVAEQIRNTVASKRIIRRSTDEVLGGITLSIGVAQFMIGETEEALIQRADRALYAAKTAGRNCTLTEASVPGAPALAVAS